VCSWWGLSWGLCGWGGRLEREIEWGEGSMERSERGKEDIGGWSREMEEEGREGTSDV
jgi:hypothetical protein